MDVDSALIRHTYTSQTPHDNVGINKLKRSSSAPDINCFSLNGHNSSSNISRMLSCRSPGIRSDNLFHLSDNMSPRHSTCVSKVSLSCSLPVSPGGSRTPSRVMQIRHEECETIEREMKHERDVHTLWQISQSCEDLLVLSSSEEIACHRLSTHPASIQSSLSPQFHRHTLSGREACTSPFLNTRYGTLSPSPSPTPVQRTLVSRTQRPLSTHPLRHTLLAPSSVVVSKRKCATSADPGCSKRHHLDTTVSSCVACSAVASPESLCSSDSPVTALVATTTTSVAMDTLSPRGYDDHQSPAHTYSPASVVMEITADSDSTRSHTSADVVMDAVETTVSSSMVTLATEPAKPHSERRALDFSTCDS